jgi:hypothetical protein
MKPLIIIALGLASIGCFGQDQLTVEQRYLNHRVMLKSGAFRRAILRNGVYVIADSIVFLPDSYIGQMATVIAVQQVATQAAVKTNALGETITSQIKGSDYVIKFDDGMIAMDNNANSLALEKEIRSQQEEMKQLEKETQSLIGKNLYATSLSYVFKADSTLDEMKSANGSTIYLPLMEPLLVTAAKWNSALGCAVVKLENRDTKALALTSVGKAGSLACVAHGLLDSIGYLTAQERQAIFSRTLVRGMSELALNYSIGFPERENDYGNGGKQLIYADGLFVYLDTQGRVTDWQRMAGR